MQSGSVIWKFKSTGIQAFPKGEFAGNPVIAGGMVFAGARDYNLYAIDIKTGRCNWMKSFPKGWAFPLTLNDSVLLVGTSEDRTLYAFDIRTGVEEWKTEAGFNIFGGVALQGKNGCFSTLAGKLTSIDLSTGKINWTIESESYLQNHKAYLKEEGHFRDDIARIIRTSVDLMEMYGKLGGVFSTPVISEGKLVVAGYDGWIYCYSIVPVK
jgi:outer membrane protein assembly factor BamB